MHHDHTHETAEITEVWWQILAPGTLAGGRVTLITEAPGRVFIGVEALHTTPAAVAELNLVEGQMLRDGSIVRHWCSLPADQCPDRRERLTARYEIDKDGALPDGVLVFPLESPGEILLLLHPDVLSPQALAELNAYLEKACAREGLWQLRWDSPVP